MRLICFGDSWTAGHGIEKDSQFKKIAHPPIFIQKLRNQNSWPRWVAERMSVEYVNMGVCGYGNSYILKDITECVNNNFLEKEDIIIVIFSYPYRYIKDDNDVVKLFWEVEKILKDYKHFYFNSFFPMFKEEDFDISKLPESYINPNTCISEVLKEYEIKNDISVWEYESRSVWNDNKNFWEGDYHPNLIGYKIIADFIYNKIIDKI